MLVIDEYLRHRCPSSRPGYRVGTGRGAVRRVLLLDCDTLVAKQGHGSRTIRAEILNIDLDFRHGTQVARAQADVKGVAGCHSLQPRIGDAGGGQDAYRRCSGGQKRMGAGIRGGT